MKRLNAVTGDRAYEEILKNGEEVNTMCEVAQRLRNEGILSQKKIDADIIPSKDRTIAELKAKLASYEKQIQMPSGK